MSDFDRNETLSDPATLNAATTRVISVSCEDAFQINCRIWSTDGVNGLDAVAPIAWEFSNGPGAGWVTLAASGMIASNANITGVLNAGGAVSSVYRSIANFTSARIPWQFARATIKAGAGNITGLQAEVSVLDAPR